MGKLKHLTEALGLRLLFALLRLLPLDAASWLGGALGRLIGPFLSAHKTAERNIAMALPQLSPAERHRLLSGMWDNLGRVAAELPHLPRETLFDRIHVHGSEYIPQDGSAAIFFSGHLGNWELTHPIARKHGVPVTLIYREANNPYVDKIIFDLRATQSANLLAKGPKSAIKLARAIKSGHSLAMLIDQKMNDGIPVLFFGRDAMTAPAIAELALRYNMRIIPARIVRTGGCHFEAHVYAPLPLANTGDTEKDVRAIMLQINRMLEAWIREYPEQWFWVHKRWPANVA
jgi:KDO2-lipid IV(A) lauroyltransferase